MSELDGLDPVVVAALIDDDDDEESKEITQAALKDAEKDDDSIDDSKKSEDDEEDAEDDKKSDKKQTDVEKKDGEKDPKDDKSKDDAEEKDESTDAEKQDEERQSRKDRREKRKQEFLQKVWGGQSKQNPRSQLFQTDSTYKPLDYEAAEAFKPEDLVQDRTKYGQNQFARGAEIERHLAEQENFWQSVQYQTKLLEVDPKYQFLNENNKDEFDADKAGALSELYLDIIGFNAQPVKDNLGRNVMGNDGQPQLTISVQRTDLPYDVFVKGYIEDMEDFADDRDFENDRKIKTQRAKQGVRPGGAHKSNKIGKLKPGDISKMSDTEFEQNEAEIDRQIAAELGL